VSSAPVQVRIEGIAERTGDIQISCLGSHAGALLAGNLTVSFPVSVTNRVDSSGFTTDAVIAADVGSGFIPLAPVTAQVSGNTIIFSGINVTVPASGLLALRISGVRVAPSQLGVVSSQIRAQLLFSGSGLPLNQVYAIVGITQQALFATLSDRGAITCAGSPIPDNISLPDLFAAGTFFASSRVTEGYATAFLPRGTGDTNGTRILLRFSGFPAGARVFVPDYVAGSSAATPTAGGDLGGTPSGGVYVPGSSTLLLARVSGADASGGGGTVTAPTGVGAISFTTASEVTLSSGSGSVAFEVLDSNVNASESAQIPVFVGAPAGTGPATAQETISFGPLSNVQAASTTAPVPRFLGVPPSDDCSLIGDCGAAYFPKLSIDAQPVIYTATAGGAVNERPPQINIDNSGGGVMPWTATVRYTDGSGWVVLNFTSGINNASIMVFAVPQGLAPGTYHASVFIDAGPKAGSGSVPVTLTVSPSPTPPSGSGTGTGTGGQNPSTAVTVSKIVNAANYQPTPLVPGSLGTAMGTNLAGKSVAISLDGLAADVQYDSATQINFVLPAGLSGKNSAQMTVAVDGAKSAAQTVILGPAWPIIFANGVLNEDNRVNSPDAAATAGSVLQIYATGIPDGATVSAGIGDMNNLTPLYAGPAPAAPGVQQVNLAVPDGIAPGSAPLVVCATVASQPFCSPAVLVAVR
jgi:uncharacterized protein (TIGR03437 family)